jgi:hypothetical protein
MSVETIRKYKRIDVFWYDWRIEAEISKDKQAWSKIEVPNISSGGLMFKTDKLYESGDILWLNAYINPRMMHFTDMRFQTKVVVQNVRSVPDGYAVGIDFITPQVELDIAITRLSSLYGDLNLYE